VPTENAPDVPFRATDFESRDLLTKLFALLNRLKPRDRLIFVLRRMESMSVPEIAATMDISISTVKRSMAHASSRMADWVEGEPGLAGLARGARVRPALRRTRFLNQFSRAPQLRKSSALSRSVVHR
jgi:hypothetical protein